MIENLTVHGDMKVVYIKESEFAFFYTFLNGEIRQEGDAAAFCQHFDDKFRVADLKERRQDHFPGSQITVKGMPVVGVFFCKKEGVFQELFQLQMMGPCRFGCW